MFKLIQRLFPSKHEKDTKAALPVVEEINRFYEEYHPLSDDELKNKTVEFRSRISEETKEIEEEISELRAKLQDEDLEKNHEEIFSEIEELQKSLYETTQEVLEEILPEAFAVVKETCKRLVGKQWDVTEHKI